MLKTIVSASILNSDMSDLRAVAAKVDGSGAEWLHFDVMDGEFVENITFGSCVLHAVRPYSKARLDVHLMCRHPARQAELFAKAGAHNITFHAESEGDPNETIRLIRASGAGVGIAIKPATPVSCIMPYLNNVDMALVMTVEPGYGGQGFIPATLDKIKELRAAAPELYIEVDGGINADTAKLVREAGANVLVAGTYLFKAADMGAAVLSLRA